MPEDIAIGIAVIMLLILLFFETYLLSKIFLYFDHKKLLERNMTDLKFEDLKNLNKQISKNLNFRQDGFKIVYAKERVVLKIKDNYFEYFKDDYSLCFLCSEETMIKEQIEY